MDEIWRLSRVLILQVNVVNHFISNLRKKMVVSSETSLPQHPPGPKVWWVSKFSEYPLSLPNPASPQARCYCRSPSLSAVVHSSVLLRSSVSCTLGPSVLVQTSSLTSYPKTSRRHPYMRTSKGLRGPVWISEQRTWALRTCVCLSLQPSFCPPLLLSQGQ